MENRQRSDAVEILIMRGERVDAVFFHRCHQERIQGQQTVRYTNTIRAAQDNLFCLHDHQIHVEDLFYLCPIVLESLDYCWFLTQLLRPRPGNQPLRVRLTYRQAMRDLADDIERGDTKGLLASAAF